MVNSELLRILRCPETRQELRVADPGQVDKLNRQITTGALKNRAGNPIKEPIDDGFIRADGKILYPIQGNIPVMLVDAGIPLD
jgi:uncharacterized protein YbaR (Trm112 family)